jgi:8-oxo-dGTP diphosphatase
MAYSYEYPRAAVTADIAVLKTISNSTFILLIKRGRPPFEGMWALPGGFMEMDETLEQTAARELKEETGLDGIKLRQFHTFSSIHRDPRHRTITTVFAGFTVDSSLLPIAGDDASDVNWFPVSHLPPMAFDHEEVVALLNLKLSSDLGFFE